MIRSGRTLVVESNTVVASVVPGLSRKARVASPDLHLNTVSGGYVAISVRPFTVIDSKCLLVPASKQKLVPATWTVVSSSLMTQF